LFFRLVIQITCKLESLITNVPRPQLKNFKVSVSQFKMSKCLGLAKKNTSLTFSQTRAFTIHRGEVLGVCTPLEMKASSWYSLLKFVYTSQLRYSLMVKPTLKRNPGSAPDSPPLATVVAMHNPRTDQIDRSASC